jgi:hypothetical protein
MGGRLRTGARGLNQQVARGTTWSPKRGDLGGGEGWHG